MEKKEKRIIFSFGRNCRCSNAALVGLLVLLVGGLWLISNQSKENFAISEDYDVFLSFRGEDTRTGFTDFLHNTLVAAGVRVFKDDEDLPMGEEIDGALIQAIRSSKISIPIISPDYAGSKNCLMELAEMKKRRETGGQLIFPIFYKVSLDEVQELKGAVGEAFRLLNTTVVDEDTMSQWEEAIRFVAKIKGWESHKIAYGQEGVLVTKVVDKVLRELKTISLGYAGLGKIIHWLRRGSKYQVFLNFYDEDTRAGFTDYLYFSLANAGVHVFSIDDPSLIGKNFAEEVYTAIKNCKVFIPIISQRYASSVSGLHELAQIVHKRKRTRQKLMPIFYKVKPKQVRKITDQFREAMTSHYENGVNESIVATWEHAFRVIGGSKGYESEKIANGHEGKLVKLVVTDVLKELNETGLLSRFITKYSPEGPVNNAWREVTKAINTTLLPLLKTAINIIWFEVKKVITLQWSPMRMAFAILMFPLIIKHFTKLIPYFYILLVLYVFKIM